jgi:hypothetical protein
VTLSVTIAPGGAVVLGGAVEVVRGAAEGVRSGQPGAQDKELVPYGVEACQVGGEPAQVPHHVVVLLQPVGLDGGQQRRPPPVLVRVLPAGHAASSGP